MSSSSEAGLAFRIGDRVEILPEFQGQGDDAYEWGVVGADDKGRVDISPTGTGLTILPRNTVQTNWVCLKDGKPAV